MEICSNAHCFNFVNQFCSVIFTKPSDNVSYLLCESCYAVVLSIVKKLLEKEVVKPR